MRGGLIVPEVPSRRRTAMISAPVSRRTRNSRMVFPLWPHVAVTSISSSWRSGPPSDVTTSRKAATCGRKTSFASSCPAAV